MPFKNASFDKFIAEIAPSDQTDSIFFHILIYVHVDTCLFVIKNILSNDCNNQIK